MKKYRKNSTFVYLNFINSLIGSKLKLEYDAYVLAGEGVKEPEKQIRGAEGFKTKISQTQQMTIWMGQDFILPMLTQFGVANTIKEIDLDYISISLVCLICYFS